MTFPAHAHKHAIKKSVDPDPVKKLFQRGLEQKQKGNYKKALEIWYRAKKKLNEPDFRIAQAYIELATDEKLKERYQNASDLYYWGLEGTLSKAEQQALLTEIRLLRPLTGNGDYRDYKNKIEDADSQVLTDIKNFWANLDPTPLNPYNERLIEHWERIAHSRENYSKPNSNELDARGEAYVKYGEPYYTRSGILTYKASFVHRVILEGIQTPSFGSANDNMVSKAQRFNLETKVRQLHRYPNYEIWKYRELTDDEQSTIFVFGNEGNTNSFKKVRSIEDFIPNEAYRNIGQHNYSMNLSQSNEQDQGNGESDLDAAAEARDIAEKVTISPALILQLMYYDQFAAFDQYFGRAYNEMMNRYIDQVNTPSANMRGLAREFGTMYGSKLLQIQNAAPQEKSEDKSEILSIPSKNYTYRFLDENNKPYLKTFSVINLQEAVYYDLLKETNSLQSDVRNNYGLITGYLLKDADDKTLQKVVSQQTISSPEKATNVLNIPYQPGAQSLTLSHELHNLNQKQDSTISSRTVYAKSLKGLDNYQMEMPEPLNTDELALSDLILGYSFSSGKNSFTGDSLNFTIAHDKTIPDDADLNLYYELYNLQPDQNDGVAEFTFHYSIQDRSNSNGFLGLGIFKKDPEDEISITLNNEVADNRYGSSLIIETSPLEAGEYELIIEIEDLNSGEEFTRTIPFDIQ